MDLSSFNQSSIPFSPVIILGAPRSGTNMIRDLLTSISSFATWPCDEVNYIWRHGNLDFLYDDIPVDRVTPTIRQFIRSRFNHIHKRYGSRFVVEKTCANSLRVPFVDSILPESRYIFIYRNGIDATASALTKAIAPRSLSYALKKLRFFPKRDIAPLLYHKYFSCSYNEIGNRLSAWGPLWSNSNPYSPTIAPSSLLHYFGAQWSTCVLSTLSHLSRVDRRRVLSISYEAIVSSPLPSLEIVLDFLCVSKNSIDLPAIASCVSSASVGKGYSSLDSLDVLELERYISPAMSSLGY